MARRGQDSEGENQSVDIPVAGRQAGTSSTENSLRVRETSQSVPAKTKQLENPTRTLRSVVLSVASSQKITSDLIQILI